MCLLGSSYDSGCFLNGALNVVTFSITCIYLKHKNNYLLWFEIYDLNFEMLRYRLHASSLNIRIFFSLV